MVNFKRLIPNLFTFFNLSAGSLAITLISNPDYTINYRVTISCFLILLGCIFDFFDGFFARLMSVHESNFGKLLDSFADLITFGILPFLIVYVIISNSNTNITRVESIVLKSISLMPCFTAYRLTRFSTSNQSSLVYFIGLPSTALGLFIGIFGLVSQSNNCPLLIKKLMHSPMLIFSLLFIFALLMVSKIRFISLKMITTITNPFLYFCCLIFILLLFLFKLGGMLLSFALYIIFSLVYSYVSKN